ncbi:MAG: hypothetical protein K0Q67_3517 [Cellvibrio sp.]|jgi:hypothetical protein|nr:hypothetical protein [Cellvibrio sp.]MDF3014328.1 hypothetical protein [Cellvibrio sp.]
MKCTQCKTASLEPDELEPGLDDAFAKAHDFKTWLYQQPNKDLIKQFLVITPE